MDDRLGIVREMGGVIGQGSAANFLQNTALTFGVEGEAGDVIDALTGNCEEMRRRTSS